MSEEDNLDGCGEVREAFHRLWSKAATQADYDKAEWVRLAERLSRHGISVTVAADTKED